MAEPLLTKRLHISGLTPSITPEDLERRLSSFGKVKAMDGFGARDVLGDPRKFGFVTMEIGTRELAKCLNVLSGSTWKGAKLRIGEAKPDFRERLAQFNSQPLRPVRLKRTYSRNHGYPSSTLPLSPLSATVAASTPGWIVTPSGRVVRPMRMRPERPLEPIRGERGTLKGKGVNGKAKTRAKPPPVRARRRLIDPTKWDSVYLKGVFLDAVPIPFPTARDTAEQPGQAKHGITDDGDEEGDSTDSDAPSSVAPPGVRSSKLVSQPVHDLARATLGPLRSRDTVVDTDVDMEDSVSPAVQAGDPAPSTNLKDLFAPREEASFSLLSHLDLDLDLELDADVLGIHPPASTSQENVRTSQPISRVADVAPISISNTVPTTKAHSRVTLDPSLPLLFPLPDSLPHPYAPSYNCTAAIRMHGTPSCVLFPSTTQVRSLRRLPLSTAFTRSPQDTAESIRERWEKDKSALTRDWKKAWREARGNRRGARGSGEMGGIY